MAALPAHPAHLAALLLAALAAIVLAVLAARAGGRALGRRRRGNARARRLAAAAERARLAREMHDSLSKTLDALALGAAALPESLDEPTRARRLAETLQEASAHAARDARNLIGDLRDTAPNALTPDGLSTLAAAWTRRTGVPVAVRADEVEVSDDAAFELAWILREALRNIAAHAGATRVDIDLDAGPPVTLCIRDDGHGFAPRSLAELQRTGHVGLVGMTERAAEVGGRLTIESAPGSGTAVTATVPPALIPRRRRPVAALSVVAALLVAAALALAAGAGGQPGVPVSAPQPAPVVTGPQPSIGAPTAADPGPSTGPSTDPSTRPPTAPATTAAATDGAPAGIRSTRGTGGTGGTSTGTVLAPGSGAACRVRYVKTDEWNTGFIADLHITNLRASADSGWTLRFAFPDGQRMTSSWSDITVNQDGPAITVTGVRTHVTIAAGDTLVVTIQGTWSGTDRQPSSFTLDGDHCTG